MAEENVNEVLGIEESTSKSNSNNSTNEVVESNNSAENTLNVIAGITLWVGIIGTIFCLFTLTTTKVVDTYSIHYDTIFNPAGLAISIGVLFSTIVTWALLRVIANISTSLKEINSKIR